MSDSRSEQIREIHSVTIDCHAHVHIMEMVARVDRAILLHQLA